MAELSKDQAIRDQIRSYILDHLVVNAEMIPDDVDSVSFLAYGILDSFDITLLVLFIEKNFEIKVDNREYTANNLDSIEKIEAFVKRKLSNNTHFKDVQTNE